MQKMLSAIMSVVLIFGIMSSSVIIGNAASLESNNAVSTQEVSGDLNDISVKATNSFGNLLTSKIDEKISEQNSNNGYQIFSVEVEDNQATVDFETTKNCSLVVAIYEEDGVKLLASGNLEVSKQDKQAVVTIGTDSMPKYFYLKAYLVDSKDLRPLSTVYKSPNYTKEMQEFFAKTTDDFDQNKVLNLDEDKTNNFAVYGEDTKIIPKSTIKNKVTSVDDNKGVYVIKNADSNITSLKKRRYFFL